MFLDNIELIIENNNENFGKNCFPIVVSDWSKNGIEKKVQQTKKQKKAEKILRNKSETINMDILSHFSPNQRQFFRKFFLDLNFCFLF